jgi:dUTP pyrophosphatase
MTQAIAFKWLAHGAGLSVPRRETAGSAGYDLPAAIGEAESVAIAPGARAIVPCGFCLGLPQGYEAQVRPRSGLAARHGVTVLNAPGTIDADYRGEVKVILINHGDQPFAIRRGERIAQMVIAKLPETELMVVEDITDTERGDGGFGSTGRS